MTAKIIMNWKTALKLALLLGLFWGLIVFLGYSGVITARIEMGRTLTDLFTETGKQFLVNSVLAFVLFCFQFSIINKKSSKIKNS